MCIVDDLVIFSYNVDDMEHLFAALEEFCHSSGLTINVDKTKMMAVWTIQPHQYSMLTYKGEHV